MGFIMMGISLSLSQLSMVFNVILFGCFFFLFLIKTCVQRFLICVWDLTGFLREDGGVFDFGAEEGLFCFLR